MSKYNPGVNHTYINQSPEDLFPPFQGSSGRQRIIA